MIERVLLVDFENVQTVDLARIPEDVHVRLVLGAKQTKLSIDLFQQAKSMGDRFDIVPIKGQQPNAVDFCIAFYLGEYLTKNPDAECVILSKDKKGFDPLVRHLANDRNLNVRRVNAQTDAFPAGAPIAKPNDPYMRVLALLGKEKHRPLKRAGLEGKIKSYFPKKPNEERLALLNKLLAEGKVLEADGRLAYSL